MMRNRIHRHLLTALMAVQVFAVASVGRAEQVRYLAEADTAFAAFAETIGEAKSSIDLATFIFETCEPSTQVLLDLLEKKARSGVRVRLLLDSIVQKGASKQALVSFLQAAGAEVRFYNASELNLRMHVKLLVVDGETYITGGRNISDRYFGYSADKNYVDRDLWVRGSSAIQADAAFELLWTSKMTAKVSSASGSFAGWGQACGDVSARAEAIRRQWQSNASKVRSPASEIQCPQVQFIVDDPDFANPRYGGRGAGGDSYMTAQRLAKKRTTKSLLAFFKGAASSLIAENWVYMPTGLLGQAFQHLRDKGIQVDIITNRDTEDGPAFFREAMDHAVKVYSERHTKGSQRVRRISTHGGLSAAHALTPNGAPFFLHGKVAVRDGRDVTVGSFNLDSRSYNTNLESTVIVSQCPKLAREVSAHFEDLQETFEEDGASGRVPPKKEASFAARMFANVSLIFL